MPRRPRSLRRLRRGRARPPRACLGELSLDQLKDVVAEHGMDPSRLAIRWKTPARLIDLIATTVRDGAEKGDVFR